MNNPTIATLFSGGELFGIGAKAAGYTHIWGVELDDKIAQVSRDNGFKVTTANIIEFTDKKIKKLERPNHLHASPPCPNFSNAKIGGSESENDLLLADAVCRFISILRPDSVTIENVIAYVYSESYVRIMRTLADCGYMYDVQNVNAADFGVPQTRIRLIVRARRGLLAHYPQVTEWVGWLSAIEDLVPSLPDTEFAQWQLNKLPEKYLKLLSENFSETSFALDGQANSNGKSITIRDGDAPIFTQTATQEKRPLRAFILNGNSLHTNRSHPWDATDPAFTVLASADKVTSRAFIVNTQQTNRELTDRELADPVYTVAASASPGRYIAKIEGGRIVKMTVQALGRFQTVPDWYKGLTYKINGNGVPCKLAEAIMRTFVE